MDPEFADLVPVFVEEARDRVERLATQVPLLASRPEAVPEVKRELHTLKGAGRMLQLVTLAELCHAAEELLGARKDLAATVPLFTRVVDRLAAMVEEVAEGAEPQADRELLGLLSAGVGTGGGSGAAPAAAGPALEGSGRKRPRKATTGGSAKSRRQAEPAAAPPPGRTKTSEKAAPPPRAKPSASGEASGTTQPSGAAEPPSSPGLPTASEPSAEGGQATAAAPVSGVPGSEIRVDAGAIDRVADQATQMRIMSLAGNRLTERIYELARLAEEGIHEDKPTQVLAVLATMLRRVAVDLEGGQQRMIQAAEAQLEGILTLQVQPLRGFLLSLARHARDLARSLGREVEVAIEGAETRLDRRIIRELDDALLHLVRNAVDHGIESPQERRAAGKPETGNIRIAAGTSGSRVRLVIEDDGGGIDPKAVADEAVQVGLVDRATVASMKQDEIFRLLFAAGFSTRRRVSEISGRGVGLDVVAASVLRVGGEVFVASEPGRSTRVTLEVPFARRGEQVFLVRVGQVRLALPKGAVRRTRQLTADQVVERGGRTLARFEKSLVPFVPLARAYGEAAAEAQLLIEGEVSGQPLALAVDEVEGEEEVLVRPVPRAVAVDQLLEGVALLASGEPVGVLSPPLLAQRDLLRGRRVARTSQPSRVIRVLLVDDSLVTREMERRLLEDAGFDVTAAGDAEEALSTLGEHKFDCLVTDIEMPGMDGFELTEHLRGIEHFGHLPIIVVSTRDRPEDRLQGLKAGADAYLTKQSLDAGELVDLVRRLSGS